MCAVRVCLCSGVCGCDRLSATREEPRHLPHLPDCKRCPCFCHSLSRRRGQKGFTASRREGVWAGESAGVFLGLIILERGELLLERTARRREGKSASFLCAFGDTGSSHLPVLPSVRHPVRQEVASVGKEEGNAQRSLFVCSPSLSPASLRGWVSGSE